MNRNIHAFSEQPYWGQMYQAAEHLSDVELAERIALFEEVEQKRKGLNRFKRFLYDVFVAFVGKPLILDNVSPLVDPSDAYWAARQVQEFRRRG